jgi:hypothetical protein
MTDITVYRIATTMDMLCNRYRIPAKHVMIECGPCRPSMVVIRHDCGSACLSVSPDQIVPIMTYNCIWATGLAIQNTSRAAIMDIDRVESDIYYSNATYTASQW